ncbi:hypothetical protein [Blastococcus sp. SYSU D00695]
MTATTTQPATTGRHRAPETTDEPRWSTPREFLAAWSRVGRHAAPEDRTPDDPFDWLGFAPAAD